MKDSDVAVVIKSTDKFEDCWPTTLECLKRFWPDCPIPIYTTSEKIPWGENPVITGENYGWCRNLEIVLDQIKVKYVLLTLEDLLFSQPVDTDLVSAAIFAMMGGVPKQIILGPGDQRIDQSVSEKFSTFCRHSNYSVSCTPTLWEVNWLREILAQADDPWMFEMRGSRYVRKHLSPPQLWVAGPEEAKRPIKVVYSAITRGKWEQTAVNWLRNIGIEVDTSRREIIP